MLGGYEQWCHEVATELIQRGHEVHVLTSTGGGIGPSTTGSGEQTRSEPVVHRLLHLEVEGGLWQTLVRLLAHRDRLEQQNLAAVNAVIAQLQPDAAMIWGMWNLPRSVPAAVEWAMPGRVSYYICDYWLSLPNAYIQRWQESANHWFAQPAKTILGRIFVRHLRKEVPAGLALERPICVSHAVKQLLVAGGIPLNHAQVVYGGTQVNQFRAASHKSASQTETEENHAPIRLIYAGRLRADKGVHTIIRGLALAVEQRQAAGKDCGKRHLTLDIYGKGEDSYVAELYSLIHRHMLDDIVTIHGPVPRSDMPSILVQFDVFIFGSEWQEPFARVVLEAMAAGLAVIGTKTGGTVEILIENETGLTYEAGDAAALAHQLSRLTADDQLRQVLANQGRKMVAQRFTFERMVDELVAALHKLTSVQPPQATGLAGRSALHMQEVAGDLNRQQLHTQQLHHIDSVGVN